MLRYTVTLSVWRGEEERTTTFSDQSIANANRLVGYMVQDLPAGRWVATDSGRRTTSYVYVFPGGRAQGTVTEERACDPGTGLLPMERTAC